MNWFDILVGVSSVGSFIVAIIALLKVDKIEKQIIKDNSTKTSQSIKDSRITNSDVRQTGRDSKGN